MGTPPGKDLGFSFDAPKTLWEQFDINIVPPRYRRFVRMLLSLHESLFAKSDLDCGNIATTLGTYCLPLKTPLPHTSHRTYFMQGQKKEAKVRRADGGSLSQMSEVESLLSSVNVAARRDSLADHNHETFPICIREFHGSLLPVSTQVLI